MEFFKFKTINYTYASNSEPVTPKSIDMAKHFMNKISLFDTE